MIKNPEEKDPKHQLLGIRAKRMGEAFEKLIEKSFAYYEACGSACVEKTPEPMKPIKNLGGGKFVAFFEKKAQPDYKGTIKGGRTVIFEAKFTSTDRINQNRVSPSQMSYMTKLERLGARCYVVVGFSTGSVYRFPWKDWCDMKKIFGRKFITERDDICRYKVRCQDGYLMLL